MAVNNPAEQARIDTARSEASAERRRNRARLERMVELGTRPDDAEAVIEFAQSVRDQRTPGNVEIRRSGIEHVQELPPTPGIYVADVASHRSGIHHGLWVDADQGPDDLQADIAAMLEASPTVGAEEWAIHATKDFGGLGLHGYTDLALVSRLARGVAEHGTAFAVWVELIGTNDHELLDRFTNFYIGTYDSPEAWARTVADDLDWHTHLDQVVDSMLRPYVTIDYARFAHQAAADWDVIQGIDGKTHIFLR